jgi:hypothetical protein
VAGGTSTSRRILIGAAAALVLVAALIIWRRPSPEAPQPFDESEEPADAAVIVKFTVDGIEPSRGVLNVRVSAEPRDLPPEGATVLTNIPSLQTIKVVGGELSPETSAEIEMAGTPTDYPFDRYASEVGMVTVAGTDAKLSDALTKPALPMYVQGRAAVSGFSIDGDARVDEDGLWDITMDTQRSTMVKTWAASMMAIYWLLAASAVGVTIAVVLGTRDWESRHLAWLGAMIFALVAFRNAAPGNPPIGSYFDIASFFWAESLVALSLLALVVFYLFTPREELKL